MPDSKLIRVSIASVWFYQGFWCKVCGGSPAHVAVISAVPLISSEFARAVLIVLGLGETCIAAWVMSGRYMREAAIVQTVLLIAMNCGGFIWAWRLIPDPIGMVLENFAFLLLIWVSAEDRHAIAHA